MIESAMRRFVLIRHEDVTGISGTGLVAEGVKFTNGGAVVRWLTERGSTVWWDDADSVEVIHGHGGKTEIVYLDE